MRPDVTRTAFAEEAETWILALGATPGTAYDVSGWEVWGQLDPLYRAGEYAGAADRGRALVEAYPEYAVVSYNVACCESLAGRPADAIEHLRHAFELSEDLRELAKSDSDLDAIRDEPAFKELVRARSRDGRNLSVRKPCNRRGGAARARLRAGSQGDTPPRPWQRGRSASCTDASPSSSAESIAWTTSPIRCERRSDGGRQRPRRTPLKQPQRGKTGSSYRKTLLSSESVGRTESLQAMCSRSSCALHVST